MSCDDRLKVVSKVLLIGGMICLPLFEKRFIQEWHKALEMDKYHALRRNLYFILFLFFIFYFFVRFVFGVCVFICIPCNQNVKNKHKKKKKKCVCMLALKDHFAMIGSDFPPNICKLLGASRMYCYMNCNKKEYARWYALSTDVTPTTGMLSNRLGPGLTRIGTTIELSLCFEILYSCFFFFFIFFFFYMF